MNTEVFAAAGIRHAYTWLRSCRGGFTASALAATALLLAASPALTDHAWQNYHLARKTNPVLLKVGDNVTSAWDSYLTEAIADWSASSLLDLTKVTGGTRPKNCRPTSGRIEVCNAWYGYNGWLGIAQVWISGSHITQGVVKVNDAYFSTKTYNTFQWKSLVMCQEIGHTIGLDHNDENFATDDTGTCMDYTRTPGGNEDPNAHDYQQLQTIYAHLDSTTTVKTKAAAAPSTDDGGESPADWGRAVAFTADGKPRVFLKRLGNGRWLRTHVTWIEGRP
jgi:hypothetical protein